MVHKQTLPSKIVRYRVLVVDLYNGTYTQLPGVFDSWPAAQSALQEHFKIHKPQSVTDYDIGGYIERVQFDVAHNPKTNIDFDEPEVV